MKQKYDIIGDIHGCADQLEALLIELGYELHDNAYTHPDRKIIFLGDFVDRGNQQKRVLDIVRPMINDGHALSVMGNHEFNAICYATETSDGEFLRPHTTKNSKQHEAFLGEYEFGSDAYDDAINWFKTLPVYLDLDDIGIVHACWDEESFSAIEPYLNDDKTITDEAYQEYGNSSSPLFDAIERVLKGPEQPLPLKLHFKDKDGHTRSNARINWWVSENAATSQRLEFAGAQLSEEQIRAVDDVSIRHQFNQPHKPTFIGHYWLHGIPQPLSDIVACVDYSVAKGGKMTAYRWSGEENIEPDNFTWV